MICVEPTYNKISYPLTQLEFINFILILTILIIQERCAKSLLPVTTNRSIEYQSRDAVTKCGVSRAVSSAENIVRCVTHYLRNYNTTPTAKHVFYTYKQFL